jgi:hypothetical protein
MSRIGAYVLEQQEQEDLQGPAYQPDDQPIQKGKPAPVTPAVQTEKEKSWAS